MLENARSICREHSKAALNNHNREKLQHYYISGEYGKSRFLHEIFQLKNTTIFTRSHTIFEPFFVMVSFDNLIKATAPGKL